MTELRQRTRRKSNTVNIEMLNIIVTSIALFVLAVSALLPAIFTVILSAVLSTVLAFGLPELLKNPARHHSTATLLVVSVMTIFLLLFDTGFLTISLCLAFGLLACFINEILRVNGREELIYSISTNVLSMICIIGSITWIIFTELYSWHFFVLPLSISLMVTIFLVSLLRMAKGFRVLKYKSLLVTVFSFLISFILSLIIVKISYKVGYQLHITSAVLLDSSQNFNLKYFIPLVYSGIVGVIAVGYCLVQKSTRIFELEPQNLISLSALNLIPISLMSMPAYILLRVIGG